jgi:succinoglycan biosynthesis protein ExoM
MTSTSPRIAVGVATYRRPDGLTQLLQSLSGMRVTVPFEVIVVNNDPTEEGRRAFEAIEVPANLVVSLLHEELPGIAAARNRILDAADGFDFLAFIDDDEVADPEWLAELLTTQAQHGAGMVTGPVRYVFSPSVPSWAILGNFLMAHDSDAVQTVPVASTNNLLIDLRALRSTGPLRFDERFGITGGSDIMLTRSFTARGGVIVWCPYARVQEWVGATRATNKWLMRRAIRGGNTEGRVQIALSGGALSARAKIAAQGGARVAFGLALLALHPRVSRQKKGARGLRMALRGLGFLAAAGELRVEEYSRNDESRA